jgi:hypothetical protein
LLISYFSVACQENRWIPDEIPGRARFSGDGRINPASSGNA